MVNDNKINIKNLSKNNKITEKDIIKIIEKKKHHHLRPNDSSESIKTVGGLISKFILIAILFFFIAMLVFEYFEEYPFYTSVTEGFNSDISNNTSSKIPRKYIVEPEPINKLLYSLEGNELSSIFNDDNNKLNPELNSQINPELNQKKPKNLDMDIIRSHRYYQSVNNSPDAILAKQNNDINNDLQTPKMHISSLRQELPSAYMISLLKQVTSKFFVISKDRILNIDVLIDKLQTSGLVQNNNYNKLIYYTTIFNYLNKDIENQSRLDSLFQICKIYLISLINIKLLELGQSHKAHLFQFLSIINSENLGVIIPNNIKKIGVVFNIVAYRKYKTHGFNIQCVIDCNLDTIKEYDGINCKIISLELLGTPMQNNLPVDKLGMIKTLKGYNNISNTGSPISNQGITGNIEDKSNIPKDKLEKEWINKNELLNKKIDTVRLNISTYGTDGSKDITKKDKISELSSKQGYTTQLYGNYKCFGVYPDGQIKTLNEIEDPITCQSYIPEINSIGVWDNPCKEDSECPFYNSETGESGCREADGKCQMPNGITRIGYKKYSKYTDKI